MRNSKAAKLLPGGLQETPMPGHLSTIMDTVESISLGRVRTFHSRMEATTPQYHGRELTFQLVPKASLGTVTVQSAEVRYVNKRAGLECWVNLSLCMPAVVRGQLDRLEHRLRDLLRPRYPQVDRMWRCNISPYVADVCIAGDSPCHILNAEGTPVKPPTDWTSCTVVPIVTLKTLYIHKAEIFPDYEITNMMVTGVDMAPDVTTFL